MGFVNKRSTCCINVCALERTNEEENSRTVLLLERRFVVMSFGQLQTPQANHLIRNKASLQKPPRAYFDWESHYFLPANSTHSHKHSFQPFKIIQYTPLFLIYNYLSLLNCLKIILLNNSLIEKGLVMTTLVFTCRWILRYKT